LEGSDYVVESKDLIEGLIITPLVIYLGLYLLDAVVSSSPPIDPTSPFYETQQQTLNSIIFNYKLAAVLVIGVPIGVIVSSLLNSKRS
jgi:uncharacterized membrane protein YfcA